MTQPRLTRRRLVAAVLAMVAGGLVLGIAGYGYVTYRLGQIRRLAVPGLRPARPGEPQNILLTGSDSRAGESPSAVRQFGSATQVPGQRSDVIVIIHLDPRTASASMLSIPRDMFVPIAGTPSSNRINVAFNQNPGELVRTINQDFGITINHYAQEDFAGLQAVTDAVGGVCMNFPYPVRDGSPSGQGNESGLNIPTAGHHVLDGTQALALVRSRYYQYLANGSWHAEGTGDIGRIQRQHEYMRALASKAIHAALGNPLTANAVLARVVHDVAIDSHFTSTGLLRLALHLRGLRPSAMPSWTLPYRAVNGYGGYGDVLMPEPTQDAQVIAAWQDYGAPRHAASPAPTVPATLRTSTVKVRVLNGSGVAGQAQRAGDALAAAGFDVVGYASASAFDHVESTIAYGPGQQAQARTLAAHVEGPVTLVPDPSLAGAVVLTTGSRFAGINRLGSASTSAPPAATATTSPAPSATAAPAWDPTPC